MKGVDHHGRLVRDFAEALEWVHTARSELTRYQDEYEAALAELDQARDALTEYENHQDGLADDQKVGLE